MSSVTPNYPKISITAPYEKNVWQVIHDRMNKLFGTKKFEVEYYSPEAICREIDLLLLQMHAQNMIITFKPTKFVIENEVYNFILDFSVINNQENILLEVEMEVNENAI